MSTPLPPATRQTPQPGNTFGRRLFGFVLDELLAQILEWPSSRGIMKAKIADGLAKHPWERGADEAVASLPLTAARRYESDEANRRNGLEDKARGNLLAITLAFSIMFTGLAFLTGQATSAGIPPMLRSVGVWALVLGIAYLLLGGIFALIALEIGQVFQMTPEEEASRSEQDQAQHLFWCTKQNQHNAQLKVNALDISFKCIRNGVVLIACLSILLALAARAPAATRQPSPARRDVVGTSTIPPSPHPSRALYVDSLRLRRPENRPIDSSAVRPDSNAGRESAPRTAR